MQINKIKFEVKKETITPIRRQYLEIKRRYPDAILLFRLGDFYEAFEDDAAIVSRECEVVLTSREMGKGQRFPMAGIPHHALEHYLAKLINKGYKVAICEQLSEPRPGKGLVERDVVRVVTPGTVVEPGLLKQKSNNYLASIVVEGERCGLAFVDITTSEFATTELDLKKLGSEIERINPAEILIPKSFPLDKFKPEALRVTPFEDLWFDFEKAKETLLRHFGAISLEGFGCAHLPLAVRAAGAIIKYLEENQREALKNISRLSTYSTESFMLLDAHTRRNLEIFEAERSRRSASLYSIIDFTRTPMGGRLLRKWLGQPLLDIQELERRLDVVEWFVQEEIARLEIQDLLGKIGDIERLINRARSANITPKELLSLKRSLEIIPKVKEILERNPSLSWLYEELRSCDEVVDLISRSIADDPSQNVGDGNVIREGFSAELDKLRLISRNAKKYLADLERKERERTGIKSLKIGYNKVFGYYIEVTTPHLHQVPQDYIRKQTIAGGERFFTLELKEYESLILNTQERISELENSLYKQICNQISEWAERILASARALAQVDVLCGFAEAAVRYKYVRPKLTTDDIIKIKGGRHPVVERTSEEPFVPNDTYLSSADHQILIITGPNMSGKSTYLRQVALIVLLAQIGSFVPADEAVIGLVDRIFTRIGLADDLATGRSTFMVEMEETAEILNNATPRSLVILDEIGRGTSTYDGLAIAKAVVEYLHNHPAIRAKTLFATHYHELTELASYLPRVKNYNIAVREEGGRIVFLRKLVPGGSDRSYGIYVAKLAGLPSPVVRRAQEILRELEGRYERAGASGGERSPLPDGWAAVLKELEELDLNAISPIEALNKLYEFQQKAKRFEDRWS